VTAFYLTNIVIPELGLSGQPIIAFVESVYSSDEYRSPQRFSSFAGLAVITLIQC
jgi:hypothetical protein